MIYIYFVPGSFGSTVEYVLRHFTNEFTLDKVKIARDGSMHGFRKFNHLYNDAGYKKFFLQPKTADLDIVTPVYPTINESRLADLIKIAEPNFKPNDKLILLYLSDITFSEINRLCQYHKILAGSILNHGLASSMFGNFLDSITQWNQSYCAVEQMQPWEFREWQSLFDYTDWLDAPNQVSKNFLKVSTKDILIDTVETFEKIIKWCGLTRNTNDLENFTLEWKQKQQYILDEHKLIVDIVDATINNISMPIPNDLNIFAQAIIQQRLRREGYELRCHGLNELPDNTMLLHNLLDTHLIHKESI